MKYQNEMAVTKEILSIIEQGLNETVSQNEIKKRIYESIPYEYKYSNRMFKNILGTSIAEYIRFLFFKNAIESYQKEKPELCKRDTYKGIRYFLFNLERAFGSDIDKTTIAIERILDMSITSKDQLEYLNSILSHHPIINSYKFDNGNVEIKINTNELLYHLLKCKPYYMSKNLWDAVNHSEMDDYEKKLMIIITNKAQDNPNEDHSVTISEDEIEHEMLLMDMYGIESPILYDDFYVFYYNLSGPYKDIFTKNISFLFGRLLYISIPGCSAPPESFKPVVEAIAKCNGYVTVSRIASISKLTDQEIIDSLWDMATLGFLRF